MWRAADAPAAPDQARELETCELGSLEHDRTYEELQVDEAELEDQLAGGVRFRSSTLNNVALAGSQLEALRLDDCRIANSSLANVNARGAGFMRVLVIAGRLTGLHLPESRLQDITFAGCRIDLASFGFSTLTRVTFDDCVLRQTDFLEAELRSVRFHDCDLTEADFRGARLQACEFRRSDLSGVQGVASLRGAAMPWSDIVELAGVWAAALGIEVLDGA